MLAGDARDAWDAHVLDDPRVISFWDANRTTGRWFADHRIGNLANPGETVWDAYLAFGPDARWQATPTGLLATGSSIIDNTDRLEQHLAPLLASG